MSLHYGNKNIIEVYYGSKKIKEIYYGSKLVFGVDSYVILTNGTRINFDLDNTPLSYLSGTSPSPYKVNGQSVGKKGIKEIYFGDSYNEVISIGDEYFLSDCTSLTSIDLSGFSNVTSIGHQFLYNCYGLTSIDLSPLSNVTSIGNGFLRACYGLTSVDFSPFSNVTSIGNSFLDNCSGLTSVDLSSLSNLASIGTYFLYYCKSVTTLIMGAETPPTLGEYEFYTPNLSLIQVPCGSEDAYKSANKWKAKASIIQGNC